VPETRTLENPNARNFLAIKALSAKRSTELRESVALYRFPWWTVNSPAKLALLKLAVMTKAARDFSKLQIKLLVILLLPLLEPVAHGGCFGVERTGIRCIAPSHPNKAMSLPETSGCGRSGKLMSVKRDYVAVHFVMVNCQKKLRSSRDHMPIYISRGRFTADAVKDLMAKPENRRQSSPSFSKVSEAGI